MASSPRVPSAGRSAPLSPERTFVVQLAPPSPRGRVATGRVEHVTSGKAVCFASWRELQHFVADAVLNVEQRRRTRHPPTTDLNRSGKE